VVLVQSPPVEDSRAGTPAGPGPRQGADPGRAALAALAAAATPVAIAGSDLRLVSVNGAFLRLWGLARAEDVVGRLVTELWAEPGAAEAAAEAIVREGRWAGEIVARCADGRRARISASAQPFEVDGAARVVLTFCDETGLREGTEELLLAQRMAHVGYWSYDVAARALRWSDETYAIMSARRDEFDGSFECFLGMLHRDDAGMLQRVFERMLADPATASFDFRVVRPGKEERVLQSLAEPVHDGAGRLVEVRGIVQDVTARVNLERQLRQSQKMEAVGSLAGGIAHDFNNLLTVILSLGSDAAEALPAGSQVREDIEEIVTTARRAEGLTRQILAFARKQVSEPVDLDVNATISRATRLLERLIGEHIAVKLSLAPGIPHVHVDPRQLEQVLMNLAVNARDAMTSGGTLAISTFSLPPLPSARHGRVELVVRDTGTGMDAETKARAFDPFFSTKGPGRGTGLGLAVVHGIVQQCGGSVSIDSTRGRGTAVRIVLPAAPAASAAAPADEALRPALAPEGRTILLVEDDETVRRVAARSLERAGYRVLAVGDGEDALRMAAATPHIDVLVTDVVMPGMSGPRLADHLRAARPRLPVLFMSGFSRDLPESLQPPAGSLLQKPFTPERLAARVAETLAAAKPAAPQPVS
jgi:signal transduction histidine kinase/CheY-like chemotaxis protein